MQLLGGRSLGGTGFHAAEACRVRTGISADHAQALSALLETFFSCVRFQLVGPISTNDYRKSPRLFVDDYGFDGPLQGLTRSRMAGWTGVYRGDLVRGSCMASWSSIRGSDFARGDAYVPPPE